MTSDKKSIALLTEIFVKKGLKHIVISPGSRNAPIIISFTNHPDIEALSIVDERSAAFFALGIAQQTKQTVAIACTSGTAALNYAPAIAEAYYQKIPLLVLTADRPAEMIDMGDGQTIRQKNIYANFIKKSLELPEEIISDSDFIHTEKTINDAINETLIPDFGPVHINLPFTEPIYNQIEKFERNINIIKPVVKNKYLNNPELDKFAYIWNKSSKKLLIAGMMDTNPELKQVLKKITDDDSVVLLTETTSNLVDDDCSCSCIDKVVSTITEEEIHDFKPDLLVTFGGPVISKMVKAFLRKNKPAEHWHIDAVDIEMDTYQCLTEGIPLLPEILFKQLLPKIKKTKSDFSSKWMERSNRSEKRHNDFLSNTDYSDLKIFETLLRNIPTESYLQLSNSTPVRYVQLFKPFKNLFYNSNRGTSGIDGVVSTASGAAFVTRKLTTLITGDLAFFYDSNALMNKHLTENLRIIIINNSGGGIFRFIQGPDETNRLKEFFEAKHNLNSKYLAKNFDIPYYSASTLNELKAVLNSFYSNQENKKPAILEIFTPNEKNAEVLKDYFAFLKKG
ncbi:MAG: 2-succinyl-5-enolpyruvyl-6-hydroxy-3-cyclohexene-1-carboxylic-acid synthase [Bacteroidetes bacterium 4484_249]|nr:MAG: 2-succinyl-5-enolpyruvyl-6-hydroxy-3-cyclohexene-1-carboxylic-acid synthase [Bacteroidetes bacterium 4484_249]